MDWFTSAMLAVGAFNFGFLAGVVWRSHMADIADTFKDEK